MAELLIKVVPATSSPEYYSADGNQVAVTGIPTGGQILVAGPNNTAAWGNVSLASGTNNGVTGTLPVANLQAGATAGSILMTNPTGANQWTVPTGDVTLSATGLLQLSGTVANALALGSSTASTQSVNDNSTKLATTAYVDKVGYLPTEFIFRDDFINQSGNGSITTANSITGDTPWAAIQIASGTQTVSSVDSTFANPGQFTILTSTASGQGMAIYKGANIGPFGNLGGNAGWDCHMILKQSAGTGFAFRAGLVGSGQRVGDAPTSGIWVRFDNASNDTQYTFETRAASTSTTSTTNSVANDTNFHHFRIRSTAAGTILFSVDGGTETSVATNVPTTAQMPCVQVLNRGGAAVTLTLDFFSFSSTTTRT